MLPSIHKILYATDLSATARSALGYAAALAHRHQAELTVLHVLPDPLEQLSEGAGMDLAETFGEQAAHWIDKGDVDKAAQAVHQRLEVLAREDFAAPEDAAPAGFAHLADAKIKVVCGDPADRILEEAAGHDMVVMGTHGQTGLLGILMGSVASHIVRHATIPVLVVPLAE